MSSASSSNEKRSFRGRVTSTLNKISIKVRGGNDVSKRERVKQKLMSIAVAFSALFFISTAKNVDLMNTQAASSEAAAPAAFAVSRGGGATAAAATQSKF